MLLHGLMINKLGNYFLQSYYLEYLEDFQSNDMILSSLAIGCIGDAYMELGDQDKALEFYEDAAKNSNNVFTTPRFLMKQATVHEIQENYDDALELYNIINDDFRDSREGQNVAKYIARAENR